MFWFVFFKLCLIGIFKDLLYYVWYGHCVLADFNLFQWFAGRTGIASYVCISVALPGDIGPFAPVCGHSEIKCNLTLAQFGEKLLQPCHTIFFLVRLWHLCWQKYPTLQQQKNSAKSFVV